jgi:hypothetical protein
MVRDSLERMGMPPIIAESKAAHNGLSPVRGQTGAGGLRPELEVLRPQEVLGAVPYAQDDHSLAADLEQNAMGLPSFAMEEFAQPFVPLGFGRLGAAFGTVSKRVDGSEE